jgi:hypothetical protein
VKDEHFRELSMGHEWCAERGTLPDPANLAKTHVRVGTLATTDPEAVWMAMQGESWSPRGEARELIASLGIGHTSMHIGDVVVVNGEAHMVDGCGFQRL